MKWEAGVDVAPVPACFAEGIPREERHEVGGAPRSRGNAGAADGRALYLPRCSARKAFQVAKYVSGIFDGVPTEKLAALKSGKPVEIAQALVEIAEDRAFALAELCLGAAKTAELVLPDLEYGDFVGIIAAIARVNFSEADRKNFLDLVPWLQKSAAGPSTPPSSPPWTA